MSTITRAKGFTTIARLIATESNQIMLRQRIPNDNSCLFTAVDFLVQGGRFVSGAATLLRQECISHIRRHPEEFTSLRLDNKPVDEYCEWLQDEFSWGGENEILILSVLKKVQIVVIPLDSLVPLVYSPSSYDGKIYLMYTGQHYDAFVQPLVGEGSGDIHIRTVFPVDSTSTTNTTTTDTDEATVAAVTCAREHVNEWERQLRQRTRKRIKCLGCGSVMLNASDFQRHCGEVEHGDSFSYECEDIEVIEVVENPNDD